MKTIKILLGITIGILSQVKAQQLNYGDLPKPVPSVSSMETYQETPVAMATGIPDIKIPIAGISSNDGYIADRLILSYNPNSVNEAEFVNDSGLGWSAFAGGVLSRKIVGGLDEQFSDASAPNYQKNKFDDIYYYNLPTGKGGKFQIYRGLDESFGIKLLSGNNIKIDFTRNTNTATLIVDSFTITDDKGYKYIFNDYSQSLYSGNNKLYRSAYFLSSIKNPSNVELLTYEYRKDFRNITGTSTVLYQSCKLKKINAVGLGSLTIDYTFDGNLEKTMNDPYGISKVTLQNNYGRSLSQYNFDYTFTRFSNATTDKRVLTKIRKMNLANLNGPALEATAFEYNNTGLPGKELPSDGYACDIPPNSFRNKFPYDRVIGVLKKIMLPTGGVQEFVFEPNEYFTDMNTPQYLNSLAEYTDPYVQYVKFNNTLDFNTSSNSLIRWKLSGNAGQKKRIYLRFYAGRNPSSGPGLDPGGPGGLLNANIKINGGSVPFTVCKQEGTVDSYNAIMSFEIVPGNHIIEILGIDISGNIDISELVTNPPPYANINYSESGLRIKDQLFYTSASQGTPEKKVTYTYNKFNDASNTSGGIFSNENGTYTLYNNVKVTTDNNGYIAHSFKTPADYPETSQQIGGNDVNVKHYFNLTQGGLLDKTEVYNSSSQKVGSTENTYELEDLNGTAPTLSNVGYTIPGMVKKITEVEKNYVSSQVIETKKELEFDNSLWVFQLLKMKNTSSDGGVYEKTMMYPTNRVLEGQVNEYAHLWNANMRGVAVNTIEKKNGKMVSSTDIKFDNGSLYPTSVVATNPNDNSKKILITYDVYDERGNLRQYTKNLDSNGSGGISTAIMYGYNNTLPIIQAEGAKYDDLKYIPMPGNGVDFNTLTGQDVDEASEKVLLKSLDAYRTHEGLKNFMVTTYTYDPMLGVTTVTAPNGMRGVYRYDQNGKLKSVIDVNGNIVKDYQYNVKPQP